MQDWPTKAKDIKLARRMIANYAQTQGQQMLGLFELVLTPGRKSFDIQLSPWIIALTLQFQDIYGADHGQWVARKVLSLCIRQGQTLH